MQESTRYVNYKAGISFIKPESLGDNKTFIEALKLAENAYIKLIEDGYKAQEARDILPLSTKTELYMTGTVEQWKHFLSLRSPKYGAQGVHPDAAKLADQVYDQLKQYIDENDSEWPYLCLL